MVKKCSKNKSGYGDQKELLTRANCLLKGDGINIKIIKIEKRSDISSVDWSGIVVRAMDRNDVGLIVAVIKLLNDYNKKETVNKICINMGIVHNKLKGMDESFIKIFFELQDDFNFEKGQNVKYIGEIVESLLKKKVFGDTGKELLSFFKEKGIFKNFKYVFTSEEVGDKRKFSFFDEANMEVFEYLVVDLDLYGDYLNASNEEKTELVKEAIRSKEYDKLGILFRIPGINVLEVVKEMIKIEEYDKLGILFRIPGIDATELVKEAMEIENFGKIESVENLVAKTISNKSYGKLAILCRMREINAKYMKEVIKANLKYIYPDKWDRKRKKSYLKELVDILDCRLMENTPNKDNVKSTQDDIVVSYVNAIKNYCNDADETKLSEVINIFDKFGIGGNPDKEDGVIILFTVIEKYEQQEEKVKRCYDILPGEIDIISTKGDWGKIIASINSVKILDNFLEELKGNLREKEEIDKVRVDWGEVFLKLDFKKDRKCGEDMLDILIEKGEDVFGIEWEEELVEVYSKGYRYMVTYVLGKYCDKFDEVLLIKRAISAGEKELLKDFVDVYTESKNLHDILKDILPCAYESNLDICEDLIVKYGSEDMSYELFSALYKKDVMVAGWTSFLNLGSEEKNIELSKYFLKNERGLMYICNSVNDVRYLEEFFKLDVSNLNAGDLMLEAVRKEELDLVKYLFKKVDRKKLDGRWIEQSKLLGSTDVYNGIMSCIKDIESEGYGDIRCEYKSISEFVLAYKATHGNRLTMEDLRNELICSKRRDNRPFNGSIPKVQIDLSKTK